jgi:hypothetical protein
VPRRRHHQPAIDGDRFVELAGLMQFGAASEQLVQRRGGAAGRAWLFCLDRHARPSTS